MAKTKVIRRAAKSVGVEHQTVMNFLQKELSFKSSPISIDDEMLAVKNGYEFGASEAQLESIRNGLSFGFQFPSNNFFGPGANPNPFSPQISQTSTLFDNLRWYLVSNFRQPLSEAYIEIGLIQKLIDTPVDDGLKGGVDILSQQLDEDQIKELKISMDRDNDLSTAGQACKWNRLYGGAGIMVMVGDQDPSQPLNLAKINKNSALEFRAVDLWELFPESQNIEGYNPVGQIMEFERYLYYGTRVHKSRVMKLMNRVAPSFLRPRLRGWGLSEVETLIRSLNQYLKSSDVIFSCLDEFKVDVFKLKGLVNTLMSPQGDQKVRQRVAIAGQQKNYENAIVLDKEDEWDHKQISFTGIAETLEGIRMQVASEMNMPITKLFGTSASAGLGNTDQNDMENYNSMVESQVRNKLKYNILRMLEIKCQFLFGFIPDDLEISFKPLRELTAVEEETVKTSQFTRLIQARQAGELDSKHFMEACNKANLFPVQVSMDENVLTADGASTEEGQDPKDPQDGVDPGSDRKDAAKPRFPTVNELPPIYTDFTVKPETISSEPKSDFLGEENYRAEGILYDAAFDAIAYEKDGGDDWIKASLIGYFKFPEDRKLWDESMRASLKYLNVENEKYRIWYYRRKGGKFGNGEEKPIVQTNSKSWIKKIIGRDAE